MDVPVNHTHMPTHTHSYTHTDSLVLHQQRHISVEYIKSCDMCYLLTKALMPVKHAGIFLMNEDF